MKNKKCLLILFLTVCIRVTSYGQLKVFIKLDDLGSLKNKNAATVLDSILSKKIKVSIGVIAKNLDNEATEDYAPYLKARDDRGEALFEVWHHGYDHSLKNPPKDNPEFNGTSYEFQFDHFKLGDELVKKKLGVQMHTFGSPYNTADSNTVAVIYKNKAYKVFLLKGGASGYRDGILYLNNEVKMENGAGNVSYEYFLSQYQAQKEKYKDFMVLQGHPWGWDKGKLNDFLKIIAYLKSEGAVFVLPYAYYQSIK